MRTSHRQFAMLHQIIRETADTLDLDRVPELFVRQTPTVNAMTIGVNEPIVVLTTGLVDLMEPEELRFVIGHELGHAMSGHSLYQTIAVSLIAIGSLVSSVPLSGIGLQAVQAALGEWSRKAELSSDRAGLLVSQDRDVCLRALMKLAGGAHLAEMDVEEFLVQAAEYGQVGDVRDSLIRYVLTHDQSHPLPVVRVGELNRWALGPEYGSLLAGAYPLRVDDASASLAEEAQQSAGYYKARIKESADPMLANVKELGSNFRGKGRRMLERRRNPGQAELGPVPENQWEPGDSD